jgi:hypothetical protein
MFLTQYVDTLGVESYKYKTRIKGQLTVTNTLSYCYKEAITAAKRFIGKGIVTSQKNTRHMSLDNYP